MGKLTLADLAKIENLSDQVKADLTALFNEKETAAAKVIELQKANDDADVIVKRAPALEAAVKERDDKIALLNTELAKHTGKPKREIHLSAFAPFFGSEA